MLTIHQLALLTISNENFLSVHFCKEVLEPWYEQPFPSSYIQSNLLKLAKMKLIRLMYVHNGKFYLTYHYPKKGISINRIRFKITKLGCSYLATENQST